MGKVLIAGATGFIGQALLNLLHGSVSLVALTRRVKPDHQNQDVEWRICDLFSLLQCEEALKGIETAFYLVHSMLPSARLTQGEFQDMDLIIADNFSRAAAQNGVKQIIYLGGLIPERGELSQHLKSRLEVEKTLASHGVPVTTLRAGLVIGAEGSSYRIFRELVSKLPLIICPPWIHERVQPIAQEDVLKLLLYCLNHPSLQSRSLDIGGEEVLSYRRFMEKTAHSLGVKRYFCDIRLARPWLWKKMIALFTHAPMTLISPLVESMRQPMIAKDLSFQKEIGIKPHALERSLQFTQFLGKHSALSQFRAEMRVPVHDNTVRSVQRMPLPHGKSALWVAKEYMSWLPLMFKTFIWVEINKKGNISFRLRTPRICLLELEYAHVRSAQTDRQVFFVVGGILTKKHVQTSARARLEFREILGSSCILAAIHDYCPTLPWPIYNMTQALVHLWVMRKFSRHLLKGTASSHFQKRH